jgi:hypothetical protein
MQSRYALLWSAAGEHAESEMDMIYMINKIQKEMSEFFPIM